VENSDARSMGERIRAKRSRAGLSLVELAELSGLTKGFLSKVENGHSLLDRRTHIVAVATALRTTPSELFGIPYPLAHPARSIAHDRVVNIRLALMRSSLDRQLDRPLKPLRVLTPQVSTVTELAQNCDYEVCGQILPSLLIELHAHAAATADSQHEGEALRLLADTCHAAFMVTKSLGFPDLAWTAAERHDQVTSRLGDPVYSALSVFLRAHTLMPAGAHDAALDLSDEAARSLEPHLAGNDAAQLYGMHHLTCAFASAVLGDADAAHARLDEADAVAGRVGEGETHHLYFGPTNVGIWRIAIGVELAEGAKVAEYASAIQPGAIRSVGRRASCFADVGRGLAQERGQERQALAAIRQAEALAPQWVPSDPLLRQIVESMVTRVRTGALDDELTGLAWRMGVR
jgi:transcriptional regulator with XRE-family HTH domain